MNISNFRSARMRMIAAIAAAAIMTPMARAAKSESPGEQRRWAFSLRVRLDQPGGQRPVEVDLSGDWGSTIIAVRPSEYDAQMEVANARLTGGGAANATADATEQLHRLARPFWVTYSNDGLLLKVHFFKDVPPRERNLLQMIVTETQLVCPNASGPVWTVPERDGAGNYLAIYNRPELNSVVKRKLKYLRTDGVAGAPPDGLRVTVDQSELRFSLDPEGGIITFDGTDRVHMGLPLGKTEQLTATVETHLANLRSGLAPELVGSLARALPDVVSSPVGTHQVDPENARAQLDGRLLDGRTTEALLQAATGMSDDRMLPDRLAALFRRRAEATPQALALLKKSGAQKQITDALAASGSAAALEGLARLARDTAAPASARVDALTAFILVQHPDAAVMRMPMEVLDDGDALVESTARMVSGGLARVGRAAHPAEADLIDQALIARYRKATEIIDFSDLLAALGNSAGPATLPVIKEALHDPREPLRAAAARALRLLPGQEIERLLSQAITSDPDPRVRADAIFAAGFRRPLGSELGEALLRAASADSADYVRSHAVTMLGRNPDASPGIAETLARIAENDASPGIRRLAQQVLAPPHASTSR